MAVPKRHDAVMEALIQQALAEIKQINPQFGTPPPPLTAELVAQLLQDDEALAALWASPEGQRAQQLGYNAADAVSEDRGE
ncbi:MAG TPA: hypothetical protein VFY89_02770 [Ktedonobacterales bacterium]